MACYVRLGVLAVLLFASVRADEIWRLDNTKQIGGHPVSVVGSPGVIALSDGVALHFDGAHDGIFVSAIPTAGSAAFTIEVLFCPEEGGAEAQRFFHVQDKEGRRTLLEIRTNGKGGWWLDAFLRTDAKEGEKGLTLIDPLRVHSTNHWYWVAMRYDGTHFADFVNGVRELEGKGTFSPLGAGRIAIGVRQNLMYWFKGSVREVRFHREAVADGRLQRVKE